MTQEIWKDVVGYEGVYQVSTLGRLKRMTFKNGRINIEEERIKIGRVHKNGYVQFDINKDNKSKTVRIHRLVSEAFISNPENKPQVNHKNGIKTDNRLENLEWMTSSENHLHAHRTGLSINPRPNTGKFGKDHPGAKSVIQYNLSGIEIKHWGSMSDASRELGINLTCISLCCKGKCKTAGGFIWEYNN